jgi:hypothetical protein
MAESLRSYYAGMAEATMADSHTPEPCSQAIPYHGSARFGTMHALAWYLPSTKRPKKASGLLSGVEMIAPLSGGINATLLVRLYTLKGFIQAKLLSLVCCLTLSRSANTGAGHSFVALVINEAIWHTWIDNPKGRPSWGSCSGPICCYTAGEATR